MSMPTHEELVRKFSLGLDDPEVRARRHRLVQALLEAEPEVRQQLIDTGMEKGLHAGMAKGLEKGMEKGLEKGWLEGRLTEARAALRRVLARRQLTPSKDDDARIEACTDPGILERWLDRAVTAARMADVLL
jgi:flagellar biosynthesis/type III secretory pathway protein FliH